MLRFVEKKAPGARDKIDWFEKGDVNGANAREVFAFLKRELPDEDGIENVSWNFTKFLVDREGRPFRRYGPRTSPLSFRGDIEKLLSSMNATAENGDGATGGTDGS